MYLIIEKSDQIYAYFESERHFKKMQKDRVASGYLQLELSALDEECCLPEHGNYFYIVIPVDKEKVQTRRRRKHVSKQR
jgi:hypothetical protein